MTSTTRKFRLESFSIIFRGVRSSLSKDDVDEDLVYNTWRISVLSQQQSWQILVHKGQKMWMRISLNEPAPFETSEYYKKSSNFITFAPWISTSRLLYFYDYDYFFCLDVCAVDVNGCISNNMTLCDAASVSCARGATQSIDLNLWNVHLYTWCVTNLLLSFVSYSPVELVKWCVVLSVASFRYKRHKTAFCCHDLILLAENEISLIFHLFWGSKSL